jgi:hypothetical protein
LLGGGRGGEYDGLDKTVKLYLVSKLTKKMFISRQDHTTASTYCSVRWTNIAAAFNAEELCNLLATPCAK